MDHDVKWTTGIVLLAIMKGRYRKKNEMVLNFRGPQYSVDFCLLNVVKKAKGCTMVIYIYMRSGLTRGAGTKNSNSTSPPPLLLCCCCCAAAAVLLLLLLHDPRC